MCKYMQQCFQASGNPRGFVSTQLSLLSVFSVIIAFSFPLQGTVGFEQHIDKCLDLSQYLYNKIKNREGYQMVFDGVVSFP